MQGTKIEKNPVQGTLNIAVHAFQPEKLYKDEAVF
jgi:hypothetical protein